MHETTVKIVMAVGALSMMGYFVEWQHVSAGVMLWWLGLIGANQVQQVCLTTHFASKKIEET